MTIVDGKTYYLTEEQIEDVKVVAQVKNINWKVLADTPAKALQMVRELLGEEE